MPQAPRRTACSVSTRRPAGSRASARFPNRFTMRPRACSGTTLRLRRRVEPQQLVGSVVRSRGAAGSGRRASPEAALRCRRSDDRRNDVSRRRLRRPRSARRDLRDDRRNALQARRTPPPRPAVPRRRRERRPARDRRRDPGERSAELRDLRLRSRFRARARARAARHGGRPRERRHARRIGVHRRRSRRSRETPFARRLASTAESHATGAERSGRRRRRRAGRQPRRSCSADGETAARSQTSASCVRPSSGRR